MEREEVIDVDQHATGKIKKPLKTAFGLTPNCAYIDVTLHTLLFCFSLGIYIMVWIYRTTAYLNAKRGEYVTPETEEVWFLRNPRNCMLLCLLVPFYNMYWIYRTAQFLTFIEPGKQVKKHLPILCLHLTWLATPLLPGIILQERINALELGVEHQSGWTRSKDRSQYREPVLCGLLFLVSFGIYRTYWIYQTTRFLNQLEGVRKENPIRVALFCLCWPYGVYWVYKNSLKVDLLSEQFGLESDLMSKATILSPWFGLLFAGPMLQRQINEIVNRDYVAVHGAIHSKYDVVVQHNSEYYCVRFNYLDTHYTSIDWNWPAFIVPAYWSLFRKDQRMSALAIVLSLYCMSFTSYGIYTYNVTWTLVGLMTGVLWHILYGLYGNFGYKAHCDRILEKNRSFSSEEASCAYLDRVGGVSGLAVTIATLFFVALNVALFIFIFDQYFSLYNTSFFELLFDFIGGILRG